MAEESHISRCWLGTPKADRHERFQVMSYNILANANARAHSKDLLEHIPALITNWEARKHALLQELQLHSPDVICLQEVDQYNDFESELQKLGYLGTYKKRTGASRDGCATFWKKDKFALLEEESVEFKEYKLRDNVAQVCAFESIQKNRVVIGNVHVMFNPSRGEVKLGQARVLLEKVHSMSRRWGDAPVVVAGDFNSTPCSSMYQFLSTSYLDLAGISGQEEKKISPGWEMMVATGARNLTVVQHQLKLRSVYSEIQGTPGSRDARGEPLVTSFHRASKGTVDYIWHCDGLSVVRVLDTPPTSVLLRDKEMPSKRWGSDHLALACELSFLPRDDAYPTSS